MWGDAFQEVKPGWTFTVNGTGMWSVAVHMDVRVQRHRFLKVASQVDRVTLSSKGMSG